MAKEIREAIFTSDYDSAIALQSQQQVFTGWSSPSFAIILTEAHSAAQRLGVDIEGLSVSFADCARQFMQDFCRETIESDEAVSGRARERRQIARDRVDRRRHAAAWRWRRTASTCSRCSSASRTAGGSRRVDAA